MSNFKERYIFPTGTDYKKYMEMTLRLVFKTEKSFLVSKLALTIDTAATAHFWSECIAANIAILLGKKKIRGLLNSGSYRHLIYKSD